KILNKIRSVAQDYLQEKVTRAVVTVPAYFTDRQRQAVKDAGKMIQLEVVRIINEPTAAALAYGIGKSLHETVVIYDLGGGTFDVSIIEIRDRVFEVKATGGDIFLGGLDFDQAMIRHVIDDAQLGPSKVDDMLLVGGQTRMPLVQKRLTDRFGKAPSKGVHPDEAVAIGAALYANSLEDTSNLRLQLLDVIPMAIGLEKAGGTFHVVFPRNAAIPNAKAI